MWISRPLTLGFIKEMSASLDELISLYLKVPPVLAKEHKAIAERALEAMEKAGGEKQGLALKIEAALKKQYEALLHMEGLKEKTLSACLKAFETFAATASADRVELEQHVEIFRKIVQRLWEVLPGVQMEIERNKQIVTRFLSHYQESMKFWSDLALERSSLYGANGKRQTPETAIQLSTEA